MMQSLPRIWSGALIGWHSNIAISFKLSFTKDRQRQKVTKVKIWMNLLQNSHYSWNIFVFRGNIWVLLLLVCGEIDQEKHKLKTKFTSDAFGTTWQPDWLGKHCLKSSVWHFCHWRKDVSLETTQSGKSKQRWLYSQAKKARDSPLFSALLHFERLSLDPINRSPFGHLM